MAARVGNSKTVLDMLSGFQGYLAKALEIPHVSPVRSNSAPHVVQSRPACQVPLLVQLRLFGLSILHLKDEELCDMPSGDLLGLWLAHLDSTGVVRVSDDQVMTGEEGVSWRAWCDEQDRQRLNSTPGN